MVERVKRILTLRGPLMRYARAVGVAAAYRPQFLLLAGVVLLSTLSYTAGVLLNEARYRLSEPSQHLIGKVNHALTKKLTLDSQLASYRFNAENITPDMTGETDPAKVAMLLAHQKQQTGAATADENLYSLDLPINPKRGTTIYDRNTRSSIKLTPDYSLSQGMA